MPWTFETHFSDDYTLSKLSTEEYIRDQRFEAHGCSIKWSKNHEARWYAGEELRHVLKETDWSNTAILCHHAQFDGLILTHHYGVYPKMWMCTLAMGRLLLGNHLSVSLDNLAKHFGLAAKTIPYNLFKNKRWHELAPAVQEQLADGCNHDVDLTWDIFLRLAKDFPPEEFEVVDSTIRMFVMPVLQADVPMLAKLWEDEENKKQARLAALQVDPAALRSNDRFAELLRAEGVEPEMKEGTNGPIYAFAKTDNFMRGLADSEDERLRTLVEARLGEKSTILQTRAAKIATMSQRGPLCFYLNYAGAHTTRWSGGDGMNWQNLKRGSPEKPSFLRKSIMAPEGYLIASPDLSQIECVAEGQLVLTEGGPKAIQDVQLTDRVWDGQDFVAHDGVVDKGIQTVISYQGLTATPTHVVYAGSDPAAPGIQMSVAAASGLDIQAPYGAAAVCETSVRGAGVRGLQDIWGAGYPVSVQERERRRALCRSHFTASVVRRSGDRPEGQRRALRAWQLKTLDPARKCQQSIYDALGALWAWALGGAGLYAGAPGEWVQPRPDQDPCRTGVDWGADHRAVPQGALGFVRAVPAATAGAVQKARVYDIVNCGPRYRFWCNGVIVSNCRVLNYLAGQWDVIERFREGKDPYTPIASRAYGYPVTKEMKTERGTGKQLELSCGYMAGAETIKHTAALGIYGPPVYIDLTKALEWRDVYRETHPAVVDYWGTAGRMIARIAGGEPLQWGPVLIRDGKLWAPNGTMLHYPRLHFHKPSPEECEKLPIWNHKGFWRYKNRYGWTGIYSGALVENVVQWLSRIILSQALLRLKKMGYHFLSTTHDELLVLIKKDGNEERHRQVLIDEMRRTPDWLPGVPLDCECELGERYEH